MNQENKDLLNPSKIEKQVISGNNINYLANIVEGKNIGIKLERTYPNGYSESLSVWDKSGEAVKEWKTIDLSKILNK